MADRADVVFTEALTSSTHLLSAQCSLVLSSQYSVLSAHCSLLTCSVLSAHLCSVVSTHSLQLFESSKH